MGGAVVDVTTATVGPRRPRRPPATRVFLPVRKLQEIAFISVVAAALISPAYQRQSLWIGVGLALTFAVGWHALAVCRVVPWIPGLTALVACAQWIAAPWATYQLSGVLPVQPMWSAAPEYFGYAVPATLALVAGLYLPAMRRRRWPSSAREFRAETPLFRATCEAMVFGGVATRLLLVSQVPGVLRFVALLAANLAFVGVFALALTRSPGWPWRAALVLAVEAYYAAAATTFIDFLLWSMFLGSLLVFRFRLRTRTIFAGALLGASLLVLLNVIKPDYRAVLQSGQVAAQDRASLAVQTLSGRLTQPERILTPSSVALNIDRLNQGRIISRVMLWVPTSEPFARGETVLASVRAALLPRVLAPGKAYAGGFENFPRFTGLVLVGATSMNLGLPGEMYANFGRWGGVAGVFVAGLFLGSVFMMFVRWSRESALWWAWAPYVLLTSVSAEMATGEVLNHVVKSSLVMLAATMALPGWSMLRRWTMPRWAERWRPWRLRPTPPADTAGS